MINSTEVENVPVRIVTADNHPIVLVGLQAMLETKFSIMDIHKANSCATTLHAVRQNNPTHLILEIFFKDGNAIHIFPEIRKHAPELRIMVFSSFPTSIYQPTLEKLGIDYYLSKKAGHQDTLQMLRHFLYGAAVKTNNSNGSINEEKASPFADLSPRELEVLHHLLRGESTEFIAGELNLTTSTIRTFKARIMEKVGVKGQKGLLELARICGYYL